MDRFLNALDGAECCVIGDAYAFADEGVYDELRSILDEEGVEYAACENSYAGIYMIRLIKTGLHN